MITLFKMSKYFEFNENSNKQLVVRYAKLKTQKFCKTFCKTFWSESRIDL